MEDDNGLLNIEFISSDENASAPKPARDYQSEESFLQQKASWKPRVENGQIWKSLSLPVDDPSKPESQKILHAVEELYFFRSYAEAEKVTNKALEGQLRDDFKATLEGYLVRCRAKLSNLKS